MAEQYTILQRDDKENYGKMEDSTLKWLLGLSAVGLAAYYLWPSEPIRREVTPVFRPVVNDGRLPAPVQPIIPSEAPMRAIQPPGGFQGPFGQ